jgi:uncharacterized membrane protein YphA (DoxX/SURF4 family)
MSQRPSLPRTVDRAFFRFLFLGGCVAHLVLGSVSPEGYAAFGNTALFGWLRQLWAGLVMPHIRAMTILVALFELSVGLLVGARGRAVRLGAIAAMGFFVFLLALGCAFPTSTPLEDFLKNRLSSVLLFALALPLAFGKEELSLPRSILLIFRGRQASNRA